MTPIITAVLVLSALSGILTLLLLVAEFFFANYGECSIDVNKGEKTFKVEGGASLLTSLASQKLFLPSGCGGRGSCGTCKCRIIEGGGPLLPTEVPYLNDEEKKTDVRLSCQVKVRGDIKIEVPEELLSIKEFETVIESITDFTHDIKGLRFKLPEGETIKFKAGQFANLFSNPYDDVKEETSRAYSISSAPSDNRALELVIRYVPNGMVTTYVFKHLKEGDKARLIGPFGEFFLRDSDREIVCIAGGSGLAPIRSIILDMIDRGISNRKATFFFGAVSQRDLYYVEEFKAIEKEHPWFRFVPALSKDDSDHPYEKGIITEVVARNYGDMKELEAYLCGSPGMIDACVKVLTGKGMSVDRVYYDKFS
ncbi:MAG: oxidoreductase [Candidatus Riflebacteria bacterium HGW-Riflebacteria-2]|jgi:Na+-transporting NADH:ubiquinone oxidoreductase subunit F|nr:MAG: oxidoreductase [Candidatus Riflebacteria bacterium HGW-Riflebacteria-2]